MEKGASVILVPVSSRRALIDLSDEVATKVQVLFYADAPDALRKPFTIDLGRSCTGLVRPFVGQILITGATKTWWGELYARRRRVANR
jgi:hypothetical protein